MRNKITFLVFLMMLLVMGSFLLTSCDNTDDGSYVAPVTLYEKIGGKWILNTVTQTDESTSKTMDLTSLFDFNSLVINLNTDAKGEPTTFTVDGTAPAILPVSGTWKMENAFVNSDGSSATILLNDQVRLTVTSLPGSKQVLEFKFTRKFNGKAFVSYTYNLGQETAALDGSNN